MPDANTPGGRTALISAADSRTRMSETETFQLQSHRNGHDATFHGSWYRGEHTNFIPSKAELTDEAAMMISYCRAGYRLVRLLRPRRRLPPSVVASRST